MGFRCFVLLKRKETIIRISLRKAVIVATISVFTLTALVVSFSGVPPASAHQIEGSEIEGHDENSATAADATNNKESMRAFLQHVKSHYDKIATSSTFLAFRSSIRIDDGVFRDGTTYIIRAQLGGRVITHPAYPLLQGGSLYEFKDDEEKEVVRELLEGLERDAVNCVEYNWDDPSDDTDQSSRVSCAVRVGHATNQDRPDATLIAGLHHNFDDVSFANLTCPYYVPKTTALDLVNKDTPENRDTLRRYVKEFIKYYVEQGARRPATLFKLCMRILPWKYGAFYMFVMGEDLQVVINTNNPSLENKTLNVRDANGEDVGQKILDALDGLPPGQGAFVEYLWDDPTTPDDNVDIEMYPDRAPGTSPKVSYVELASRGPGSPNRIFGSGFYPPDDSDDSGGCTIAGTGNTPQSTVFNLFLIAAVLFSAALWKNRSRGKQTMWKKVAVMRNAVLPLFVFALALLVFFSVTRSAVAHDGPHAQDTVAGEVGIGDEDKMMDFVLHAKAHWESIGSPNENILFEDDLTKDGGDWRNDTVYLMVIDEEGAIFTHPLDSEAQNGVLRHFPVSDNEEAVDEEEIRSGELNPEVQNLINKAKEADEGGCVPYEDKDQSPRVACAVKFTHPVWRSNLILIGGYHHLYDEHDDSGIDFDGINCPYFVELIREAPYFIQGTTANEVEDGDTLKKFVERFAEHFTQQVEIAGRNPANLAKIRNCWRELPWKHGAIYVFIMTEDGLVFFNGNTPTLENGTINLKDDNECNVGDEIIRVIDDRPRECKDLGLLPENPDSKGGGFVEYLWDDPTDDVPADLEAIEEGRAPGDVPKLSYVKKVSFDDFFGGETLIIGSGYHPEVGDDGCAIAGAANTAKGALFNLLLIVFVLFSAALWKNRSRGKQK